MATPITLQHLHQYISRILPVSVRTHLELEFMTGEQLTVDKNSVVIVEKAKSFDFKLLKTLSCIIAVIQGCVSRESIKKKSEKQKLTYSTLEKY